MSDELAEPPVARPARPRLLRSLWRKVRDPLARSRLVKALIASSIATGLRAVYRSNRPAPGSDNFTDAVAGIEPVIFALWHGQHLLAPCFHPGGREVVAMFSRSADAELNALVFEKLGFEAVRGSGGRDNSNHLDKGGARALIALKKALDAGRDVAMIADIPHGTPRDAGLGIVMLARFSRRPIVPVALVTSRRKVLEKTWDKTTISLPFGRGAVVFGEPIHVAANADPEELEARRREVTLSLNAATAKAYRLADAGR